MIHTLIRPRAPLDRCIDFYWVSDAYIARAPRERVLPTGSQALIINLGERPVQIYADESALTPHEVSGAVVCGPRSSPLIIDTTLGQTVGVRFKPGGARPFFDVSADAFSEKAISLGALWGDAVSHSLRERLLESPSAHVRVQVLEEYLLRRARRSFELRPILRASMAAFEDPELTSVAELNRRTGLSPKGLLALFRDEIGLSPKAFWRVQRFRAALRDVERGGLRGAALAAEHGYCDQAHFLREFRALAGSSPREYLTARVVGTDHVSILG